MDIRANGGQNKISGAILESKLLRSNRIRCNLSRGDYLTYAYLEHSAAGSAMDRFKRAASKFEGAARLVNDFLLRNRRGIAARPTEEQQSEAQCSTKQCTV